MNGFIEIKEDSYDDTLEHLHRIKTIVCKLIKMLSAETEVEEETTSRLRSRYNY